MIKMITRLSPVKREDFEVAISSHSVTSQVPDAISLFSQDIEIFKKFAVGKHMWFIANLIKGTTEYAGGMTYDICGIGMDFIKGPPDQLFNRTNPEDLKHMFAFTNYWINLFFNLPVEKKHDVHPTIYVRLKNGEGQYKWTMVQYANHIFDQQGNLIYALTLITDISHIKKSGPAMMSILDTSNENCQHFFCTDDSDALSTGAEVPKLTVREIEILGYLSIGYSSKQLADELGISIKTIDNHRQNMLHKTNTKSTAELVSFAIKAGFI